MVWHTKYWDAVEQLYWTPSHLGLRSIPRSQWGEDSNVIQFPREAVQASGSIYTRAGSSIANAERMRALEETLNHIFDITFAIAPDQMIAKLLHAAAQIQDQGPFERVGKEMKTRFGWGEANVTQPDGFFVSPSSILSVELKLGSKTRPEQVLKYLAVTHLEECRSGRRAEVALLYITPQSPHMIWQQAGGGENGHLPPNFISQFDPEKLNSRLKRIFLEGYDQLEALSHRLRLAHLSWHELVNGCNKVIAGLEQSRAGDETLARLLLGFVTAVQEHKGTNCVRNDNASES